MEHQAEIQGVFVVSDSNLGALARRCAIDGITLAKVRHRLDRRPERFIEDAIDVGGLRDPHGHGSQILAGRGCNLTCDRNGRQRQTERCRECRPIHPALSPVIQLRARGPACELGRRNYKTDTAPRGPLPGKRRATRRYPSSIPNSPPLRSRRRPLWSTRPH